MSLSRIGLHTLLLTWLVSQANSKHLQFHMVMLCQDAGKSISLTWTLIDAYHILASRLIEIGNVDGRLRVVVFFNLRQKISHGVHYKRMSTHDADKTEPRCSPIGWVGLELRNKNMFMHTKWGHFLFFVCALCLGTNWTSYTSNINGLSSACCGSDGSWSPKYITFSLWAEQCCT